MTQYTDSAPTGADGSPSTTDIAKDEARNVGQTAAQAGSQVASTAADQAKQVTQETKRQAQDLLAQGRTQATEQMRNGQQQAAGGLSALAGELRSMVDHNGDSAGGPAHDLVRQATDKADELADWLKSREPGDLLDEVRQFARRRPAAFLLGAALAGIVAGRLTTGVVAAHKDDDASGTVAPAYSPEPYPATQPAYANDPYTAPQPAYSNDPYAAPQPAYSNEPYAEARSAYTNEPYTEAQPAFADDQRVDEPYTAGQPLPPLPYGTPPPGSESNWADPQRPQDDGTRL